MPIDLDRKILFVHIPKCSGVYVSKLLGIYANNILHSTNNIKFPEKDCHIFGRTLQHYTINMIVHCINTYNCMQMGSKNIDLKLFKIFTIVRSPYSRFISAYKQYPNRCNNLFKYMIGGRDITSFAEYLYKKVKNEGYEFFSYGAYHQFQPMHFYTENKEKFEIEIIKLDNEDYDIKMRNLCKIYNVSYKNEKLNKNPSEENYKFLINKKLVNYLNFIYEKDFQLFNYEKL